LTIESTGDGDTVAPEDYVAIETLLSSSDCLKYFHFQNVTIDPQHMQSITKATSDNQSLPLRSLVVEGCTFHGTAAHCLAMFITKCTALHHLRILRCTLSAHGLLELAQAIHHSSSLQERELKDLTCTVDGDDEATQLLVDYAHMKDFLSGLMFSHISDRGTQAIATVLSHSSTLEKLDLSNNSINDARLAVLAPVLRHRSGLRELNLSNNSIGDTGSGTLAEILSHKSMKLNLSGNGAISAVGTHQLVQALTGKIHQVTPHRHGSLVLPRRCEEYVTQCPQYSAVQNWITFE